MKFKVEGLGAPFWVEASEQAAAADTVQAILTAGADERVWVEYDNESAAVDGMHPYYAATRHGRRVAERFTIGRDTEAER